MWQGVYVGVLAGVCCDVGLKPSLCAALISSQSQPSNSGEQTTFKDDQQAAGMRFHRKTHRETHMTCLVR